MDKITKREILAYTAYVLGEVGYAIKNSTVGKALGLDGVPIVRVKVIDKIRINILTKPNG